MVCPVCGYYCNGKGGKYCIDKVGMYQREAKKMNEPRQRRRLMGAESEYRSELFALDKASLIERIAKAEAEARQLREQLAKREGTVAVSLFDDLQLLVTERDALRSQLERLQSGFDALCTAHADLGQQAAKLEAQLERAYMPASDEEWEKFHQLARGLGREIQVMQRCRVNALLATRKQERG